MDSQTPLPSCRRRVRARRSNCGSDATGGGLRLSTYEATGGERGAVARDGEDAFARVDARHGVVARGELLRLAAFPTRSESKGGR